MGDARLAPSRRPPSRLRHASDPLRTFGLDAGPLSFAPPQPAGWAHLVTLRSGAATVRRARGIALVTPHAGVWVPAGEPYVLDLHGRCALRIAYVGDGCAGMRPFGVVAISPLLAELLARAVSRGYLDPARAPDARLLGVIADEIAALRPVLGFALALPQSPALRAVVERALRRADEPASIASLAESAAMSLRTFERAFLRETGVAPRTWLRRARLHGAASALAVGASVTEAGLVAGYASLSAFIAAYRRAFGTTPGAAPAAKAPMRTTRRVSLPEA